MYHIIRNKISFIISKFEEPNMNNYCCWIKDLSTFFHFWQLLLLLMLFFSASWLFYWHFVPLMSGPVEAGGCVIGRSVLLDFGGINLCIPVSGFSLRQHCWVLAQLERQSSGRGASSKIRLCWGTPSKQEISDCLIFLCSRWEGCCYLHTMDIYFVLSNPLF